MLLWDFLTWSWVDLKSSAFTILTAPAGQGTCLLSPLRNVKYCFFLVFLMVKHRMLAITPYGYARESYQHSFFLLKLVGKGWFVAFKMNYSSKTNFLFNPVSGKKNYSMIRTTNPGQCHKPLSEELTPSCTSVCRAVGKLRARKPEERQRLCRLSPAPHPAQQPCLCFSVS